MRRKMKEVRENSARVSRERVTRNVLGEGGLCVEVRILGTHACTAHAHPEPGHRSVPPIYSSCATLRSVPPY